MDEMSTQEPREIAFEDIRAGDDIEARYEWGGVTCTRRGIAHTINSHTESWYAEAGGLIANGYDYEGGWKFYLHSRPVPAEPKGLGAVVRGRDSWSTPLAEQIAREHRYIESSDECPCGGDSGPSHALHIATVTEQAARERIAAKIEGLTVTSGATGTGAWSVGYRSAIEDAARIARGATDD